MARNETKKKRIAVIGLKGLPAFGGAATVGQNLIEQLKHDFDFTVYAVSSHVPEHPPANPGYRQIVFRKSRFRKFNIVKYMLQSMLHVMTSKYDLVHIHHGSNGFITPVLRLRYKVVLTLHGIYRDEYHDARYNALGIFLLKSFQWLNLRFATRIVSVSADDATYLKSKYHLNPVSIPNGVSIPKIAQGSRGGSFIVFAAGRIYNLKGLHLILEALRMNGQQTELRVIGNFDPSYHERILKLSEGLNVTFMPLIREKDKLFEQIKGAEFFVFPSLSEAMSMMLLEVAALKVPLIASNIPANQNVFNGDEVLFFESGNAASLAEKMRYAGEHKMLMTGMAEKAYSKVSQVFTWEVIARQYRSLFNGLMGTADKNQPESGAIQ